MAEGEYQLAKEGGERVLRINYEGASFSPSIEDDGMIMSRVFDILQEIGKVSKIIFLQREEYEYDWPQVRLLSELVDVYKKLAKEENIFDFSSAAPECQRYLPAWQDFLKEAILRQLKEDPVGAFVALVRKHREEIVKQKTSPTPEYAAAAAPFLRTLQHAIDVLAAAGLIKLAAPRLAGFKPGDRAIYREHFKPTIRPYFTYTKLVTSFPAGAEELASYKIAEDTEVLILRVPTDIRPLYHMIPPEFKLTEEKYALLTEAREVMAEHKPQKAEFTDPARTREIFFAVERDLLTDLAKAKGLKLSYAELEELAKILLRYTLGFGLIEILTADPNVQDIVINAPLGTTPISLIHGDFGECRTNITPLPKEGESWATKLRLISGRPFDEANPVLDSDLNLPYGRARVAALQRPLSPAGFAFAFRRHRDKSWTLPLFIQAKMLTPLAAGLISFLVDGARTMFVAGTRSAGKTSLLSAMLVEISRNNRILTCEDSVAGDSQIIIRRNDTLEKTNVRELIDGLIVKYKAEDKSGREILKNVPERIEVLTSDIKGKIKFAKASAFIRHKVTKPIYEITTATGRKVKVTGDHSLFSIGEDTVLEEVKASELKVGSFLATPRILPVTNSAKDNIDLLNYADKLSGLFIYGDSVRDLIVSNWARIKQIAKENSYSKSRPSAWRRLKTLPMLVFEALGKPKLKNVLIKPKSGGKHLPAQIALDEDLLTFIGLWLADGCYDKDAVIVSACEPEERDVVNKVAAKLNLSVRLHSDKFSLMIHSSVFKNIMQNVLGLKGNAYTKKIPSWIYQLSQDQIAYVLKGVFSGDGCASDKEVVIASASKELLKDIQTLLLSFEIIFRVRHRERSDKTYHASISALKFLRIFRDKIGFVQKTKTLKLDKLCSRISTHDSTDIVPLSTTTKLEIAEIAKLIGKSRNTYLNDYVNYQYNVGREHLAKLLRNVKDAPNPIKYLAESDIYWDRVIEVKKLEFKEIFVYDISVPETENFVCENIIAHNTLELPVQQLHGLGYDILSMKTRSVITGAEAEVPAEQAVRAALRLGDSALILGEVRSVEARALFEAMRVGALAKVVAGTIHGASPYDVYDRVVNDLGVPKTSFKAADIIMVANTITSPSGFERYRRLTQISEVRKFWVDDPLIEKGFADLMAYNAAKDIIEPTNALIEGESDILKAVGGRVREWVGNWDAIWQNIELRAKIKQALIDAVGKSKLPDLLEAPFVVASNDEFHRLCSIVAEEVGFTDPKRVYAEWQNWLKQRIKKQKSS